VASINCAWMYASYTASDGQDLTVGQDRVGAALAEPPPGQPILNQAVHPDEQRRSIHARPPYAW
jgi:hypothetical protein